MSGSSEQRTEALTREQVLVELLQECHQRLAVQQGQLVACQQEGASDETFAACRRDIAVAQLRVDALSRALEDSKLLDLMEQYEIAPIRAINRDGQAAWGLTHPWGAPDQVRQAVDWACRQQPKGWPDPRAAMRAVAAVLKELCPNGCGPITWDDPYNRRCPECGFHGRCGAPRGGWEAPH